MKDKTKVTRNTLSFLLFILTATLVVLLVILRSAGGEPSLGGNGGKQPETVNGHAVETKDGKPVDEFGIETKYCTLYCPSQWEGSVFEEIFETDNSYKVVFYGTVGDKKGWLYTVYFGTSGGDAFPVGMLATEGGATIAVSVEMSDFMPSDSCSQTENDTMCAMQESVNHMIARLEEESAFRPQ